MCLPGFARYRNMLCLMLDGNKTASIEVWSQERAAHFLCINDALLVFSHTVAV